MKDTGLPEPIIKHLEVREENPRKPIPLSVKTRLGFNQDIVEEWIGILAETPLSAISLHGRTLKQMYAGNANWESIARGAKIAHAKNIVILGNGDIHSMEQGKEMANKYGADGFLIGRAALGNPGIFAGHELTLDERINTTLKHVELFANFFPNQPFVAMRKHLAWYIKSFPGASEIRQALMQCNHASEVKEILMNLSYQPAKIIA
jgi:tRNA-dihydrouridine synthase